MKTEPTLIRELEQLSHGSFEPVGLWKKYDGRVLAPTIANNLPIQGGFEGEPRHWTRRSGHTGFCLVK